MLTMPEPQTHDKRRAPRYYLGGVVELTDLESGRLTVAMVRALSLYGCFVKTEVPVKQASRVALKIAHSGIHFSALGRVVHCAGDRTSLGLGIEFTEVDAGDKVRLEACLTELAATHKIPPVPNP
jgi:hypothetical protein